MFSLKKLQIHLRCYLQVVGICDSINDGVHLCFSFSDDQSEILPQNKTLHSKNSMF